MNSSSVPRATPESEEASQVENLFRDLLKRLGLAHEIVLTDGEEKVFDIDLDGHRYLLIRMPKVTPLKGQLSPREQEIVRMVARGHPNKVIAGVLNISSWTVSTYLRRIFAKLGVASRAAMVARLMEQGINLEAASPRDARNRPKEALRARA